MNDSNSPISLVVPAYNEQDRIEASLIDIARFIEGYPRLDEVLIVDDGSSDSTAEIVRNFIGQQPTDTPFRLLQYGANRGKGYAVAHGLKTAQREIVAFSDTDLSAPIDQLTQLIDAIESGADIAIGSRRLPDSVVKGLPGSRQLMGKIFSKLTRVLVVPGIADTQCGFKAYRKEVAHKLVELQKMDGYTFDVEHLLLARQMGLKVAEIPVLWIFTDGSQINGLSDSIKMFKDLLALRKIHKTK